MGDRSAPEPLGLVHALVNTLDVEEDQDALGTPEGLAEFVRVHELSALGLAQDAPHDGHEPHEPHDLRELRELRDALRDACLAHTGADLSRDAARTLEHLLSRAPLVLAFGHDGRTELRPAPGLSGVAAFTARIASDIAAAEAAGTWQRLKACEAGDCRWVFYDRRRAGRGRWCSMAVCGSRAKMRAYRGRQRTG